VKVIDAQQLLERLVAWRYGPHWSKWHITASGTGLVTLCGRDFADHDGVVRLGPPSVVDVKEVCSQCFELVREELHTSASS
jgi:hypothetical protein